VHGGHDDVTAFLHPVHPVGDRTGGGLGHLRQQVDPSRSGAAAQSAGMPLDRVPKDNAPYEATLRSPRHRGKVDTRKSHTPCLRMNSPSTGWRGD
jgi:hypothetical protein